MSRRGKGLIMNIQLIVIVVFITVDYLMASEFVHLRASPTATAVIEQKACASMNDWPCDSGDGSNSQNDSTIPDKMDRRATESLDWSRSNNDSSLINAEESLSKMSKVNPIPPVFKVNEEGYFVTGYGEKQLIFNEKVVDNTETELRLFEMHSYMHSIVYIEQPLLIQKLCRNTNELCTFWASTGQCEANPNYMMLQCAPACFSCDRLAIPYVDTGYGEHQHVIHTEEEITHAVHLRLAQMHEYMHANVYVNQPRIVRDDCLNKHEECTFWAARGECEKNPDFMTIQCAPACFACDKLLKPPSHFRGKIS